MTLIPLTEQPSNKPGLSWSAALMQEYGVGTNILEDMEWAAYWTRPYNGVADEIHFTIYVRVPVGNKICVSNHHSLLTVLTITSVQVQMQRNVRKPDVLR